MSERIVFADVSKFYGDVLGVNRVDLDLGSGLTALVGPNGSGKTTLMNLMTGLIHPTQGAVSVLGVSPRDPVPLFRLVSYCTQFDSFPRGVTGTSFLVSFLRLRGLEGGEARERAAAALHRVGLTEAAGRRISGYSKGMRQRARLALALATDPRVLVLDEPLNGLDPMVRADLIALFRGLADEGRFVVVSSHILHEVDMIADQVVLLNQGYVVAEGDIPEVREEMVERPHQIVVRCSEPATLAAELFAHDHVVGVKLHPDGGGLLLETRRADRFYLLLNELAGAGRVEVEGVAPADEDALAVYQYLVGGGA